MIEILEDKTAAEAGAAMRREVVIMFDDSEEAVRTTVNETFDVPLMRIRR